MAGDWIKMRTSLATCPAVVRLASGPMSAFLPDGCPLPVRVALVVGALHATWSLFDAHTEDGILAGYTPEVLDGALGLQGWTEALAGVGWIVVTPDGLTLPDFGTHNGKSAKKRAQDAERKRAARALSAGGADACPPGKRTKRGPEKRREEKMQHARARELPDAAAAVPPPGASEPEPPPPAEHPEASALVFEVLAPGGLGQGAIPEALELLAGPTWLGGHELAAVRAALEERVEAARGKRNAGAWLLTALRNGGVPATPAAAPPAEDGNPRLRRWEGLDDDPERKARREARLHREAADRLEVDARRADEKARPGMLAAVAAHRRRAAEIEAALDAAPVAGVGG